MTKKDVVADMEVWRCLQRIEAEMVKSGLISKTTSANNGVQPRGIKSRMAEAAKTSVQQVDHWYKRGTMPKPSHFAALAETLGTTVFWLRDNIRPEDMGGQSLSLEDPEQQELDYFEACIELAKLTDITALSPVLLRNLAKQIVVGRDEDRPIGVVAESIWANFASVSGL